MLESLLWGLLITLYLSRLSTVIAILYHFSDYGPSRLWRDVLRAMLKNNFTILSQLMCLVGLWGMTLRYSHYIQTRPFEQLLWMIILCVLDLSLAYFMWTAERNPILRAIQQILFWILRR